MRPAGSPAASPKPGTPPRPGFWVRTGGFPHPPDRASGPRKAGWRRGRPKRSPPAPAGFPPKHIPLQAHHSQDSAETPEPVSTVQWLRIS